MNNVIHKGYRTGTKLRAMRVTEYLSPGGHAGPRRTHRGVLADSALHRKPRVAAAPVAERRDADGTIQHVKI